MVIHANLFRIVILCFRKFECCRRVTRNFFGQGSFLRIRALYKHSTTARERNAPPGKNVRFFAWKLLKAAFQTRNFTHSWPQLGHFFSKLGHFFPFFEKGQGRPPPLQPLVTRLCCLVVFTALCACICN